MWKMITRSAPGWSASASAVGVDSNAKASVSSERKKIAPSRCSCSSADRSSGGDSLPSDPAEGGHARDTGVAASSGGVSVMALRPDSMDTHRDTSDSTRRTRTAGSTAPDTHEKARTMPFPPLTHVARHGPRPVRERPLVRGAVRRQAGARRGHHPRHAPHGVPARRRTLFGLHQHETPAPDGSFSEYNVGLDHIAFGCADRGELEKWANRLDELGYEHSRDQGRAPTAPA